MKRLKIFSVAVFSVLLMIIISSNIFAAVQSLNSNGTLEVKSAAAMYAMNNVFCVENGQILTGEWGSTTYRVKCSIHIRGKQLTLKKWNQSDCTTAGCNCDQFNGGNGHAHKVETFDGYNNGSKSFSTQSGASTGTVNELTTYANKLAGIFYTDGLDNGGSSKYGEGAISAQQITVWYAWNGFISRLPSDGTGHGIWDWGYGSIKEGSGNVSKLSSNELSAAQANWNSIDTNKEYAVDLYYLSCGTDSWQALMLYDKNVQDLTIDIPVKKVWNDDNNRDGKRLNSIEVELLKNGNATGNKRTLSVNNNWSAKFTNLAKQENGRDINYSVREYPSNTNVQKLKNSGYTESVSGNATNGFTITNTYVPEKTSISVEKEWKDGENRDAIRPTSIQVTLMADGSKVTKNTSGATITNPITLNEQNGWKYEFTDLYKNKNGGTEINYSVTETLPDGYSLGTTKTVDGNKISIKLTNTHVPQEVQIPVKKVWDDDTDRDGLRPSEIKLTLKADGVAIATHTLTGLNTSNEWSYTFTSTDEVTLYKYKNVNGKQVKIVYTVEEEKITNSQSYDSQLKYEDPVINPSSVTAKDGDANKTTDTITITNKHKPETTKIVVIKNWDDDDNRDDMRPQSITFRLKGPGNQNAKYADGKEVELIVLNKNNSEDNNKWTYEVKNLPRYYDHGKEINYTLEEVNVPAEYKYEVGKMERNTTTGAIIEITGINHHDPELIEIPITKTWDDDTDRDGLRPDSIQLELWADKGTQYEKLVQTAVITGSKDENTWSYTFKSTHQSPYEQRIFKYRHNGILINYTIVEREIRNSQPYNKDEKYENPKYTTGRNTTSTDKAGTITGSKTIRDTRTDGFGVINKHEPETTNILVRKIWDDDDNRDDMRKSITFRLKGPGNQNAKYADGKEVEPIVLSESNGWQYEVKNVFRYYDHGKEINYTLEEVNVPAEYTYKVGEIKKDGTTGAIIEITGINHHDPELIEIPITKTWDDDTDRDGLRPDSIQLELWADKGTQYEKLVQTAVITGSKDENTWSYTFKSTHQSPYEERIFKYRHEGILINYTIVEKEITNSQPYNKDEKYENPKYTTGRNTTPTDKAGTITGSKTIRDTRTDGFEVINKHEPERTRIVVRKDWKDKTDLDEYRPDTIELVLLANGQEVRTDADGNRIGPITLRDPEGGFSDTWEYTVENLFRYYDHGKTIDYTVIERNVPDHYNEEEVNISKQEYTPETGTQIITITKPNTHEPHYDGYIEIKGKVWLDKPDGKANAINGILDDDETGIEKVKVILKDKDGKAMNATYANERGQFNSSEFGYTANDGTYTIRVNYDNSYNVYKLYEEVSKVQEKLKTAYVEFQYDGLKYTTVKQAATGANTSKAIENETSRANFDRNHSTVNSTTNPDTWSDKYVEAITKDVISFETYSDKTVDSKRTEVVKYCKGNNTYIRTNPEGAWNDVLTGKKSLSNHRDHTGNCSSGGHTMRTFEVEVEIINNVNLGLFEREQPDIAIFSELSKVELVMNNQHYTYLYSNRTTVTEEKAQQAYDEAYRDAKNRGMSDAEAAVYAKQLQMQVKFQNADTYTYRRPVNPADIAYIQEQTDPNILNVKVSYDIKIGNLSTTLPVTVNSIKNYFDNEYTLESCYTKALKCTEQHMHGYRCYERANNITAAVNANNGGQFKNANINGLSITVQPQTESAPIELTYNVSLAAIKRLLNEESTLNNAVEIDSYSTQYGANTLYAEQRTGGRTGNPYAGYDSDSRPGNVVPENRIFINSEGRIEISNIEDDEDIAPAFTLCKDEEKTMSGNVWEDSDINENDDLRLGDGKKTSGEQNLANAKVELLKPVVDAAGERLETAKLYSIEGGVVKTRDAVTYSDSNGNYTFGDDIFGVVTDRYVMKFTYGEGMPGVTEPTSINRATVNARNYKSTIISSDTVLYEIFKGTSTNEEWHLNIPAGRSIAVDTIEKRLEIDNLRYSNFDDAIYMEAYSKPFKMQVEFDSNPDKTSDVDENGENANLKNNLAVFDFGIVERARENIVVEKTIEHLNVTLANGNILTQGDPTKDTLDYVSAPGLKNRILTAEDSARYGNKSITIQVDPELIQGARLELKYAITVRNNSEKDYDYETNTDYYFFGEKTGNIIKSSVNYLVDYMDNKSAIKWDNEGIWQVVKADDLTTGGFISTETGENTTIGRLESGKYNAYVTDQFKDVAPGEAKTEYATVTRTLANSDENLCENHIEILEIDSKVARTIEGKDKNTGTPIMKSYKMGNYIPSLDNTITANEQDDDRIKITVTGPTGLTTYVITYLVVGLAGLIILVIGVVIIKKKVLTK